MLRKIWRLLLVLCWPAGETVLFSAEDIHGIVRDVTRRGLSNIIVQSSVFDSSGFVELVATTDSSGRYSFPALPGFWSVAVDTPSLNRIGYLGAGSASWDGTNENRFIPFTTRRLDLRRLVSGIVKDEFNLPVQGLQLQASITENSLPYSTNFVTAQDGSFVFGASPAIWEIRPQGGPTSHVFPVLLVDVEHSESGENADVIAPRSTTQIRVATTNLSGKLVSAECRAYGGRYVQSVPVYGNLDTLVIPVFEGSWTITVTNRPGWVSRGIPPDPITVAVSNNPVQIGLSSKPFESTSRDQEKTIILDLVTQSGVPVKNATGFAIASAGGFYLVSDSGFSDSKLVTSLSPGSWEISVSARPVPTGEYWLIRAPIRVTVDSPTNIAVVFPDISVGPQLEGTVRDVDGGALGDQVVNVEGVAGGTNYSTTTISDADGRFAIPVLPGNWVAYLQTRSPCIPFSTATIHGTSQHVELTNCPPPIPVTLSTSYAAVNDFQDVERAFRLALSSGSTFFETNIQSGQMVEAPLNQGISTVNLWQDFGPFYPMTYELLPSLELQQASTERREITLVVRTATARIEGRLRDSQGHAFSRGYATARANIGGTNYSVSGQLASGYFSLNVIPGEWEVAASVSSYLSFGDGDPAPSLPPGQSTVTPALTDPSPQFMNVTNGVNFCEFITEPAPAMVPLEIAARREDGSSIERFEVSAYPYFVLNYIAQTNLDLTVRPGVVSVVTSLSYVDGFFENLLMPSITTTIPSNSSNSLVLIGRTPTRRITGTVTDLSGRKLPLPVEARTQIDGTNYTSSACAADFDEFRLPVFPGRWTIRVPDWAANGLNYESVPAEEVIVPANGESPSVNFVLHEFEGDFRTATLSRPARQPDGGLESELTTKASLTWRIDASPDFEHWSPVFNVKSSNGSARVPLPPASDRRQRFYRAVWIR